MLKATSDKYGKYINNSAKKNKLISAIQNVSAKKAGTIVYMPRSLVAVSLPHSKPDGPYYQRRNGNYMLTMTATNPKYQLPYGSLARLELAWITTQAVINSKNKLLDENNKLEISLGKSFATFIKTLGLSLSGGVACSRVRLREQMLRLINTTILCHRDDNRKGISECAERINLTQSYQLWWNPDKSEQGNILAKSTITLSKEFFNEIISSPVPVDFRALQALTKSPLQMDIYTWLTYRFSFLEKDVFIPWGLLKNQLGTSYPDTPQGISHFKNKFKQAMYKVWEIYSEANVQLEGKGVLLLPSPTHVKKQEKLGITAVDN